MNERRQRRKMNDKRKQKISSSGQSDTFKHSKGKSKAMAIVSDKRFSNNFQTIPNYIPRKRQNVRKIFQQTRACTTVETCHRNYAL